jgi:hypothetical protein
MVYAVNVPTGRRDTKRSMQGLPHWTPTLGKDMQCSILYTLQLFLYSELITTAAKMSVLQDPYWSES